MGDTTMEPLPFLPQVIDYAHHPLRSPRLDIILCARARCILGNTSGIFLVGSIFGVPSAANMVPMSVSLIKPGHYAYKAASRISSLFLRKYEYLLK